VISLDFDLIKKKVSKVCEVSFQIFPGYLVYFCKNKTLFADLISRLYLRYFSQNNEAEIKNNTGCKGKIVHPVFSQK
jgi:hypothetical protein